MRAKLAGTVRMAPTRSAPRLCFSTRPAAPARIASKADPVVQPVLAADAVTGSVRSNSSQ